MSATAKTDKSEQAVDRGQTVSADEGRVHLRQPRRVLDADSSGCSSSVPIEGDPIARAAGFLHARSSGLQSDAEQRKMIDPSVRFCVGVCLDLKGYLWIV